MLENTSSNQSSHAELGEQSRKILTKLIPLINQFKDQEFKSKIKLPHKKSCSISSLHNPKHQTSGVIKGKRDSLIYNGLNHIVERHKIVNHMRTNSENAKLTQIHHSTKQNHNTVNENKKSKTKKNGKHVSIVNKQ